MERAEDVRHPGIVAARLALEILQCLEHVAAALAGDARIGAVPMPRMPWQATTGR